MVVNSSSYPDVSKSVLSMRTISYIGCISYEGEGSWLVGLADLSNSLYIGSSSVRGVSLRT